MEVTGLGGGLGVEVGGAWLCGPLGEAPLDSASAQLKLPNDQDNHTELCRLQPAHLYMATLPMTLMALEGPQSRRSLRSALGRRKKEQD